MQTIAVRTTQNVSIHYPIASVGERVLGYAIDRGILLVYTVAVVVLLLNIQFKGEWIWLLVLGFPWLLFSVLFEIFMNGQTPGKRLLKIQVVRLDGTRATVGDYIVRWIFAFIDFFVLGGAIALIIVAAGGKGQRLGDVVAGTTVVKLAEQKEIAGQEIFITAEENYIPTFAQAVQLNPSDIELMQRALEADRDFGNSEPLESIYEKIKTKLGIQSELPPQVLVNMLIKDFSHFASR